MTTATMIRASLGGALITTILVVSLSASDTDPKGAAARAFMRQKLTCSQAVLEGLASEKFDVVSKNAIRLRYITQCTRWFNVKQPEYTAHIANYQKSVDALYMAAIDKNLDAATAAYTKLARSCVECHRLVRADRHKHSDQSGKAIPMSGYYIPGLAP